MLNDTIAAISTALSDGAISIVRVSGDEAIEIVKNRLPRIKQIMEGKVAPHRCETCAYCRMTKKAKILSLST